MGGRISIHKYFVTMYTVLMWFDEKSKKVNDSLGLKNAQIHIYVLLISAG
jgi:hypothetical protein